MIESVVNNKVKDVIKLQKKPQRLDANLVFLLLKVGV